MQDEASLASWASNRHRLVRHRPAAMQRASCNLCATNSCEGGLQDISMSKKVSWTMPLPPVCTVNRRIRSFRWNGQRVGHTPYSAGCRNHGRRSTRSHPMNPHGRQGVLWLIHVRQRGADMTSSSGKRTLGGKVVQWVRFYMVVNG